LDSLRLRAIAAANDGLTAWTKGGERELSCAAPSRRDGSAFAYLSSAVNFWIFLHASSSCFSEVA
jgi:hypothetical protein